MVSELSVPSAASIFDEVTEVGALLNDWRLEAARSEARGRDGLSPANFAASMASHVQHLSDSLRNGTYKFIVYRQVLKSRGASRFPRVISVPAARDRAPLKAMVRFLHRTVPASRGVVAQTRVREVAQAVQSGRYRYFVRLDVKDFYPSIKHRAIELAISREVQVPAARAVLMAAVQTPTLSGGTPGKGVANERGVPQGLPISNAIAELVLSDFDSQMTGHVDRAYFRYVDDILVLTRRREHRKVYREISAALRTKGLECHPLQPSGSKSTWGRLEDPIDFLGYSLSPGMTSVRADSITRLKTKLVQRLLTYRKRVAEQPLSVPAADWERECQQRLEWFLNISITGCVLDGHRRGWIHYFSLMNDFRLLRSLDCFVEVKLGMASLLPAVTAKSFVASYRRAASMSSDGTGYVPNFDEFDTGQQRDLLRSIFRISEERLSRMSATEVESLFYRRLRRELDTLETDLALTY